MMFAIDRETGDLVSLPDQHFSDLDILEVQDLEEWVIDEPRLLGEELLVITSEYAGFEDTLDRLDILALDRAGNPVVVELKRDRADTLTDLQAIKYASFCSTLTAQDLQELYQEFWSKRQGDHLSKEDVAEAFVDFLSPEAGDDLDVTDEGWIEFEVTSQPRIMIAAGSFGTEVTSPVMWLIEEFGLDIACVRFEAYEHDGRVLVQGQTVIPVPEAEEYMTKRREKKEQEKRSKQRPRGIVVLLDRDVLVPGDVVVFNPDKHTKEFQRKFDPEDDYWRAEITGRTGMSDNVRWLHDDETYSFTRLAKVILDEQTGRDPDRTLNGYKFWVHPEFERRTLKDLRNSKVQAPQRKA